MPEVTRVEHLMLIDRGNDVAVLQSADTGRFRGVHVQREYAAITFQTAQQIGR